MSCSIQPSLVRGFLVCLSNKYFCSQIEFPSQVLIQKEVNQQQVLLFFLPRFEVHSQAIQRIIFSDRS